MPDSATEQPKDLKDSAIRRFTRIAEARSLDESEQRQILALSEPRQIGDERLVDDLVLIALVISFRSTERCTPFFEIQNGLTLVSTATMPQPSSVANPPSN